MINNIANNVDKDMTVIICTCDSYSDVMELFFAAFKEYWPTCSYPVVINTELKETYSFPARVQNYQPGPYNSWGDRLLKTLHSIDSEFTLLTYDDFILEQNVCNDKVTELLNVMKADPNISVVYLIDTKLGCNSPSNFNENIVEIDDYTDYRLNSAPAIWRKSHLINYIGVDDNPWAWEFFGSIRTFGDGNKFYCVKRGTPDIYPYNYNKGGAIYRGRWVKSVVVDKFEKYKINIDTSLRGFSEDAVSEARSLRWKIDFFLIGYKMVGIKSLRLFSYYIKAKFNAKYK